MFKGCFGTSEWGFILILNTAKWFNSTHCWIIVFHSCFLCTFSTLFNEDYLFGLHLIFECLYCYQFFCIRLVNFNPDKFTSVIVELFGFILLALFFILFNTLFLCSSVVKQTKTGLIGLFFGKGSIVIIICFKVERVKITFLKK